MDVIGIITRPYRSYSPGVCATIACESCARIITSVLICIHLFRWLPLRDYWCDGNYELRAWSIVTLRYRNFRSMTRKLWSNKKEMYEQCVDEDRYKAFIYYLSSRNEKVQIKFKCILLHFYLIIDIGLYCYKGR